MVTFMPIAVGKPNDYRLAEKGSEEVFYYNGNYPVTYGLIYKQNPSLDVNGDGIATKEEVAQKVVNIEMIMLKTLFLIFF